MFPKKNSAPEELIIPDIVVLALMNGTSNWRLDIIWFLFTLTILSPFKIRDRDIFWSFYAHRVT